MDVTKETYEKIADGWMESHQSDTWWIDGTDAFASLMSSGARVLDVGCAGGVKAEYLVGKGLDVVGIDYSENMIGIAKRRVPKAVFYLMDMRDIDSSLGLFDGIFMQASLLHIPKKEVFSTLMRMRSVLNPEGCLYIAVKVLKPGSPEEEMKVEDGDSRFFSYFTMDELRGYMKDLDFDIRYEKSEGIWLQIIGQEKEDDWELVKSRMTKSS